MILHNEVNLTLEFQSKQDTTMNKLLFYNNSVFIKHLINK